MFTSVGTFAGDWDRSFLDDDRRTDAVVVGTVSQPSSLIMVRLLADRSRLTRVGLRPAFLSSSACVRYACAGRVGGVAAAWQRAGGVAETPSTRHGSHETRGLSCGHDDMKAPSQR